MIEQYKKLSVWLFALLLVSAPALTQAECDCGDGCDCGSDCNCSVNYCSTPSNNCSNCFSNFFCGGNLEQCCPECCGISSWFDDLTLRVEMLVWRPCLDDMEYCCRFNTDITDADFVGVGEYHRLNYKWQPAFRVHLEKDNLWNCYDFRGIYTFLRSSQKKVTDVTAGGTLVSTLLLGGYNFAAESVTSQHDLTFHQLDLVFGRDFCWGPCNIIHPYIGVGGIIVDQDIHHEAFNTAIDATGSLIWHSEYWGVGLEIGNDFTWKITDCLSFFTQFAAAILAGDNDAYALNNIVNNDTDDDVDLRINTTEYTIAPGYRIGVGLEYAQCWCGHEISARIGYDFNQWYNIARTRNSVDPSIDLAITNSPTTSSLGFHGFNIGVGVSF